jgi:protein-S-isoprenylcysteine O-methyltransferase Ste14
MVDETPFRFALVAIVVSSMAITAYHRIQAAKSGERISRRDEGCLLFLTIRLSATAMLVATIAYLVNPAGMEGTSLPLPPPCRWAGAIVGAIAIGLLFWTLNALGTNLTDTVVTRKHHTLVTTGPYRWVRHPFYDVLLLLVIASSLLAANWFILLAGTAVFFFLAVRTRIEERKLVERFGEEYFAYISRTNRFVPLPRQRNL